MWMAALVREVWSSTPSADHKDNRETPITFVLRVDLSRATCLYIVARAHLPFSILLWHSVSCSGSSVVNFYSLGGVLHAVLLHVAGLMHSQLCNLTVRELQKQRSALDFPSPARARRLHGLRTKCAPRPLFAPVLSAMRWLPGALCRGAWPHRHHDLSGPFRPCLACP